jgi:hypothetical protein
MFREVRREGKWESLETPYLEDEGTEDERLYLDSLSLGRNYWLFGLLARGVRTEWEFSWDARGLPEDVSDVVKHDSDQWDCDGHNHSWLSLIELKHKATELLILPGQEAPQCGALLRDLIDKIEWPADAAPEDCRVVFWFDN